MKQTTTARLRYMKMSPRKMRLVADMVRGMQAALAVTQLAFSKKAAALPLKKLIASAMANAVENHRMNEQSLVIKSIQVDGGPIQYRYTPRAFGRAAPIRKRTAHVVIELEGDVQADKSNAEIPAAEPKKTKAKKKKAST